MEYLATQLAEQLALPLPRTRRLRLQVYYRIQQVPHRDRVVALQRLVNAMVRKLKKHPVQNCQEAIRQAEQICKFLKISISDENLIKETIAPAHKQESANIPVPQKNYTSSSCQTEHTIPRGLLTSDKVLIADIEGAVNVPLEIAILVVEHGQITAAFLRHGLPSPCPAFFPEAPYSHGISAPGLRKVTSKAPSRILEEAKEFILSHMPAKVTSNDLSPQSDIFQLLGMWGLEGSYTNSYVGDWKDRIHNLSHQLARVAKTAQIPIASVYCPTQTLHTVPTAYSLHDQNPTKRAKAQHASHCSLYDALEVFLHFQVDRQSSQARSSH
jgi:hypothetical protein